MRQRLTPNVPFHRKFWMPFSSKKIVPLYFATEPLNSHKILSEVAQYICHNARKFLASHVLCGICCYSYKRSKTSPQYHHHFCKYLADYCSADRIEYCDHYITH